MAKHKPNDDHQSDVSKETRERLIKEDAELDREAAELREEDRAKEKVFRRAISSDDVARAHAGLVATYGKDSPQAQTLAALIEVLES